MMEQIELLKTVKADKEDLEDALADKADTQAVNRKVLNNCRTRVDRRLFSAGADRVHSV